MRDAAPPGRDSRGHRDDGQGSNTTIGTQNDYFYTGGPTVTFVSPNTGPASGNTIVTITGTGFTSSGMTVKFGAVTAVFTYIDTTTIVAVAPAQSAGTVTSL